MYIADANVHNRNMDDDDEMIEFRIKKLRSLVDKSGGPAAFARQYSEAGAKAGADKEISETYVSQILNRHRNFRERAARNMEKRAGLPRYYFDTDDDEPSIESNKRSYETSNQYKQSMIEMILNADDGADLKYVEQSLALSIGLVTGKKIPLNSEKQQDQVEEKPAEPERRTGEKDRRNPENADKEPPDGNEKRISKYRRKIDKDSWNPLGMMHDKPH